MPRRNAAGRGNRPPAALLFCATLALLTAAGCRGGKDAEAAKAPVPPATTFNSQIDANPNLTPEQKAAAKAQVQQLPNARAGQ